MDRQNGRTILISIVAYKAENYIKRCLDSLIWTTHYKNISIAVVDNSPTNVIESIVNRSNLDIAYHFTGDNIGFGKGHNYALKKFISQHGHEPELIMVVNPDLVLKEKPFRLMLTAIEDDPSIAIVGPKLLDNKGVQERSVFTDPNAIDYTSGFVKKLFFPQQKQQTGLVAPKKSGYVKGLSGACMLIKRKALKGNIIFDPDYFMYFEDLDLCKRISKDGWKIMFLEQAKALHSRGGSSESDPDKELFLKRMMYHSLSKYFKKNKGPLNVFLLWLTLTLVLRIKILLRKETKWSKETYRSVDKIFQERSLK